MLSPDAQVVLAAAGRVPSRPDVDPEPQTLVRGLSTHVTLPPRFPGISSVWLHKTSHAESLWPTVQGVSMRPEEEDTFDGVPEATVWSPEAGPRRGSGPEPGPGPGPRTRRL